jgi:glycosyltransferase involved in cell wall biosynthesis
MEKIAINIPYYKIDFFEATLSSIANQTDKRFTVYIGNDSSNQDPSSLLEKYVNKFSYVYQNIVLT